MKKGFLKSGHLPTLIACFAYFDLSFAVWAVLGPLAVLIAPDLQLDAREKGLMVTTPVLAGALLRIVNGVLVGQWKARRTAIAMQLVVIAGLLIAWKFALHSFPQVLALGLVLGVAGASFAIALPGFGLFAALALAAWGGIAAVRLRWREDAALAAGVRI